MKTKETAMLQRRLSLEETLWFFRRAKLMQNHKLLIILRGQTQNLFHDYYTIFGFPNQLQFSLSSIF